MPSIVTKGMEYHYPAEFIVPTNVPYDIGPIGKAFETEFQTQEVPIGLQLHNMLRGFLVIGGTKKQRFLTNFKIAYETAIAEGNYLILTTNKEWRRILDLVPESSVLRLGTDFTLNPLDVEGSEPTEHAKILTQAFTQTFYLSRLGSERIMESIITLLGDRQGIPDIDALKSSIESKIAEPRRNASHELNTVFQFLYNCGYGPLSLMLGETDLPISHIMNGITVIEIDLKAQQELQFVLLCLLAKIISYCHSNVEHQVMILIDSADNLMPIDPYTSKTKDVEQHLLNWFHRLKELSSGVHLSLRTPSRFPPAVLNAFQTIISYKITAYNDVKVVRDLLQFLPDRVVHSGERHDNYQVEFLKTLPEDIFIMKRNDIPNAFPVQSSCPNLRDTHIWTSEEIRERLRATYPDWRQPSPTARTILERDFRTHLQLVQKLLSLLSEYPELGKRGILSSLNSDPEIDIDLLDLERILHRLVVLNYVIANEWNDGQGHIHQSYQLKDKGRQIYQEYVDETRDSASSA